MATVAVSLILWSLAFAIVSLTASPTEASMRASATALWICGMVTTLLGALVGGYLAGYLPGNARRPIFVAHGFLAWCVAFLVSFLFGLALMRSTATMAMMEAGVRGEPTATTQEGMTQERVVPEHRGTAVTPAEAQPPSDATTNRMLRDSMIGMSWSWFGTWIVALGFAVGGASLGARRLKATEDLLE